MDHKLEEVHEEFLAWAETIGVEIRNVCPMRLSGRGYGVVASNPIPEDTEILTVPCVSLRTKTTVPMSISKKLPKDITVHGLLAADLALNTIHNEKKYGVWDAVLPSRQDIQLSMPLTWPKTLQDLLPTSAKRLLQKQRNKFDKDWGMVSGAFPFSPADNLAASCTREEYMYTWLLVNTRTFYYVTPQTEKLPKEDHMALQPVADLFNHIDQTGCHVAFDHNDSYSFRTRRAYEKGEEVHISYGSHSNDFLLTEYGFVLTSNVWDEVCLDDAIMIFLSKRLQHELEDVHYLGNYVLDRDTVCHRTQVAIRLLLTEMRNGISMGEWRRFVSGLDGGEKSQRKANALLAKSLCQYKCFVLERIKELTNMELDPATAVRDDSRRDLVLRRWEQIEALLECTIKRLG